METIHLTVEGMSCGHCVNRIKNSVGALNGVESISVDLDSKSVTVQFDPEKTKNSGD
jgi:copper chaperone